MQGALKFIKSLLLIFLIISAIIAVYGYYYLNLSRPLAEEKTVILPKGSSLIQISETLEQNGIIRNHYAFAASALLLKLNRRLQAGEYKFDAHISPLEAMEKVARGEMVKHSITIPEGLTTTEILKIITDDANLTESITMKPIEGDLLPETYIFSYGYTRDELIHRMMEARIKFLTEEWEKRAMDLPLGTPEKALTLASIVEKETGLPEERPRIAGVFINRLKKGMPLQSDPTVIYAITNGKSDLNRALTTGDLKIQSPYNTYMVQSLPPAPIANPGKESIHAALHPAETNELYFVASGNGGHLFSATLDGHNKNVKAYRKLKSESGN